MALAPVIVGALRRRQASQGFATIT
jgi:hypothetical protein